MQLQLHYTNSTTPQLQLHYITTTTPAALHHTTSSSCGWGDRPGDHCNHCNHSKKNTAPTTFRSISGFALPSVIHNNQSLLYVSYFWNFRHCLVRYYWSIMSFQLKYYLRQFCSCSAAFTSDAELSSLRSPRSTSLLCPWRTLSLSLGTAGCRENPFTWHVLSITRIMRIYTVWSNSKRARRGTPCVQNFTSLVVWYCITRITPTQ